MIFLYIYQPCVPKSANIRINKYNIEIPWLLTKKVNISVVSNHFANKYPLPK
jgi:hypothetical protein